MEIFNDLVNSFLESRVGLVHNFLNEMMATQLKENLLNLYSENQFRAAGVGNNAKLIHDKQMRSDEIYWLDRKHNDSSENSFFDLMDQFVHYLNSTCYTGITGYEFHYAMYEKGSFYKRHLDQFRDHNKRAYTMIMYLNDGWKEIDGGELCIYHKKNTQIITPVFGKCVFFESSELEHEVFISNKSRMSITGWLKTN